MIILYKQPKDLRNDAEKINKLPWKYGSSNLYGTDPKEARR